MNISTQYGPFKAKSIAAKGLDDLLSHSRLNGGQACQHAAVFKSQTYKLFRSGRLLKVKAHNSCLANAAIIPF